MAFTLKKLKEQVACGEDSSRQFKLKIENADSLAAEMAAFANANGCVIFIGVDDCGRLTGLTPEEARKTNQLISNAASQHARSPLLPFTENVLLENGRIVIILTVREGMDKPYFDRHGVIWFKAGSDKRRINSKEELRRIFQYGNQFHADELPTKAGIDKLDKLLFRDFLKKQHGIDFPDAPAEQSRLLQNLNLATGDGRLNLAGALLFAERPELIFPQFVVKGIRFPGTVIHAERYDDAETFEGPLSRLFKNALAFIMRNLHKVQGINGVNSPGAPEVPELVFEELLVNALMHRDYLVSAPVRIFIFDDRVEMASPGALPNNLTIANIKAGNSNIRNPILISYAAKGLLPYHGIGSGVPRALGAWPDIVFDDDREGMLFRVIVRRPQISDRDNHAIAPEISPEAQFLHYKSAFSGAGMDFIAPEIAQEIAPEIFYILDRIAANPRITAQSLADALNISRRTVFSRINLLKKYGILRRVGPNKSGKWEIVSEKKPSKSA